MTIADEVIDEKTCTDRLFKAVALTITTTHNYKHNYFIFNFEDESKMFMSSDVAISISPGFEYYVHPRSGKIGTLEKFTMGVTKELIKLDI